MVCLLRLGHRRRYLANANGKPMKSRDVKEIYSKLKAIGLVPFASRLLSQEWRQQNSVDSQSSAVARRIGPNEVWFPLEKRHQKLKRLRYPSGQVLIEEIRDVDDHHFTDSELLRWHESGSLQAISLRVSEYERQFVSWNEDGNVSHRTIDRKAESFDRIVCLNCGDHTLTDGFGHAGFGGSGYMYSDSGRYAFRWDAEDPAYRGIVGDDTFYPWALSLQQKEDFEHRIKPLPDGTRFRFSNVARCGYCAQAIAPPLPNLSYLLLLGRTIWTTFRTHNTVPVGFEAISLSDWVVSLPR